MPARLCRPVWTPLYVSGAQRLARCLPAMFARLLHYERLFAQVISISKVPRWNLQLISVGAGFANVMWAELLLICVSSAGQVLKVIDGHTGPVKAFAVSADGGTIVSGGVNTVRVWSVETGQVHYNNLFFELIYCEGGKGSVWAHWPGLGSGRVGRRHQRRVGRRGPHSACLEHRDWPGRWGVWLAACSQFGGVQELQCLKNASFQEVSAPLIGTGGPVAVASAAPCHGQDVVIIADTEVRRFVWRLCGSSCVCLPAGVL
jgi:hypothetical protein